MHDIAHYLRPAHLGQLRAILDDPEASDNDRFVALDLLKNAAIAAGGVLPMCQDTGTAIVKAKKGQCVFTGGGDEAAIARGVYDTYLTSNLRYSQMAPITMYDERNTDNNLPAEIKIAATDGDEYKFLFIAKGGGSANKSYLYQETKALLNEATAAAVAVRQDADARHRRLPAVPPGGRRRRDVGGVRGRDGQAGVDEVPRLAPDRRIDGRARVPRRRARAQGAAARPDHRDRRPVRRQVLLPRRARRSGSPATAPAVPWRWRCRAPPTARRSARSPATACSSKRSSAIRRASCPTSPTTTSASTAPTVVRIDLTRPMDEIRAELSKHPVRTRVMLTGPMVVARDIAHAKIKERLDAGESMPQYLRDHCVYYAGPAKTPEGYASGSFGPTTAGRMDSYVDEFQAAGGSMVMLAKGNRSRQVTESCREHGGFYLGSIGGAAARLALDNIKHVDVLEYPELGMEAVWKIDVVDFPAFIVVDDKGNDFFEQVKSEAAASVTAVSLS